MNIYTASLLVSLGLFAIIFGVAYLQKNQHFINAFWPLGFLAIALFCFAFRLGGYVKAPPYIGVENCGEQSLRFIDSCTDRAPAALSTNIESFWPVLLITGLIAIWGMRLAWHILKRSTHREARLEAATKHRHRRSWSTPLIFAELALSEAVLLWVVSLPIQFLFTLDLSRQGPTDILTLLPFILGVAVWLFGFAYELISDRELRIFSSNPKNDGKVMQSGLWRYSRHPHYFGEALMWWGVFITTFIALEPRYWLAISPLLITYMLRYVSGVPVAEKHYKGSDTYQKYRRRTSAMLPLPPRS